MPNLHNRTDKSFHSKIWPLRSILMISIFGVASCGLSSPGPSDELFIEEVNNMIIKTIARGYGTLRLSEMINVSDIKVTDRSIIGNKATVTAQMTYRCLTDYGSYSRIMYKATETLNLIGSKECKEGRTQQSEVSLNFVKFDSGWQMLDK